MTVYNPGSSTSSGVIILGATGSVNSSNTSFTFSSQPSIIISDGVSYQLNKGWTWNSMTLTATMAVAPSFDIYGIK